MRNLFAILIGKLIYFLTRYLKIGGGSAAPGLYALKINPDFIEENIRNIKQNAIITGTNGKTTTSRLLAHFAKKAGLKVIRNSTGSNLERGIASSLIQSLHLEGVKLNYDLGIWEVDEAAFNDLAPKIKPSQIVFLNAFRDQLDRYGEVDTVVKNWVQTLARLDHETNILINCDDANTSKLKNLYKGKTHTFGIIGKKIVGEGKNKSEDKSDIEAINVKLNELNSSDFDLVYEGQKIKMTLPLPGIYNIYNFLAAFGLGINFGISTRQVSKSLNGFTPAFGRVEKFSLQPRGLQRKSNGYIFLIKNPVGATQVFETVAPILEAKDRLLFALNDNLADGKDVSWIWDAEFEQLTTNKQLTIICSGIRAYDMALRLKYSGIETKNKKVELDLNKAFKVSTQNLEGNLYIFPTYTAMLDLQKILVKTGIKKHYWKEE